LFKPARDSLQNRLTISFLMIVALTTGLVVLFTNRIIVGRFNDLVFSSGQIYAGRMAQAFGRYYELNQSWEGVDELVFDSFKLPVTAFRVNQRPFQFFRFELVELTIVPRDERLILIDRDMNIIADSDPFGPEIPSLRENLDKGVSVYANGEQVGTVFVASSLGRLTALQNAFLKQVNEVMVISFSLALVAVVIVGTIQSRRIIAPIKNLVRATSQVAEGDFTLRIPVTRTDELGEMTVAFNTMAERLAVLDGLRKRATEDIAHELRTPLTVLQLDLESIEDGVLEPSPEIIRGLQKEVEHLNRLVEDLRTLSLADAGELRMNFVDVDLNTLASEVLRRVELNAEENQVTLKMVEFPEPVWVCGDRQRLSQAILNLMINAIQYTPQGGNVTLRVVKTTDSFAQLSVEDTGEGIEPQQMEYIFERFYRIDESRDRSSGGSGLGLSIARSLIRAHGGEIWAESLPGTGSKFTFSIPLSALTK